MKNTIKNITITVLLAWVTYLLLGDDTGVVSLKQFGIPLFIVLFGVFISMMARSSNE